MKLSTKKLVLDLLGEHANGIEANLLHLVHQRSIEEHLRIADLDNDELDKAIEELETELPKYTSAIEDICQ